MAISPVETPETPHPHEMNSKDALDCLEASEACIEAMLMEYKVQGSISLPLATLAVSNLHVAQTYLEALLIQSSDEEVPF